jgi:hypothetical protein
MPTVSQLFTLKYGHSLELNRLEQTTGPEAVNFVSRTARNNGVSARIRPIPNLEPAAGGTISVALGGQGGAGTAFLQPFPYYCGRDVMVLTPIEPMSEQEKLWWATCITANRFRFGFGRQANKSLRNLLLPSEIPQWVHTANISSACATTLTDLKRLSSPERDSGPKMIGGGRVKIEDLFDLTYGTSLELNRLVADVGGVHFIARTSKNNGVVAKVVLPSGVEAIAGGCLTVALSGSVLETFYQREPFITGFHIMVLRPKEPMVPEELMFYAACIRANQLRYSYGRQANRTLKDLYVPVRDAIPIWVYGSITRVANQLETSGKGVLPQALSSTPALPGGKSSSPQGSCALLESSQSSTPSGVHFLSHAGADTQ